MPVLYIPVISFLVSHIDSLKMYKLQIPQTNKVETCLLSTSDLTSLEIPGFESLLHIKINEQKEFTMKVP